MCEGTNAKATHTIHQPTKTVPRWLPLPSAPKPGGGRWKGEDGKWNFWGVSGFVLWLFIFSLTSRGCRTAGVLLGNYLSACCTASLCPATPILWNICNLVWEAPRRPCWEEDGCAYTCVWGTAREEVTRCASPRGRRANAYHWLGLVLCSMRKWSKI